MNKEVLPADENGQGSFYIMWKEDGEWQLWDTPLKKDFAIEICDDMVAGGYEAMVIQECAEFDV